MQDAGKATLFDRQVEEVRAQLRRLAGHYETEELIAYGDKVTLRHGQSIEDGISFLERVAKELRAEATWSRQYRYRPMDGAAATYRVMKATFGGVSTPGGMGFWGPTPPSFIDLEVAPGKFEQVPALGDKIVLPHLPEVGFIPYEYEDDELGTLFILHAAGKKAYAGEVQAIFALVEDELRSNSIYKGKAIHDGFGFLNINAVDPAKVVYAEVTQGEMETNIYARLRHPEVLRQLGTELKGAVLLEGTYGTGKTLAAYLTAQEAVKAGWTFILVRPEHIAGAEGTEAFRKAMQTAELYDPAVVFVEDVDTLTHADAEQDRISVMLDVFDGARAKGREVLAILTTNHADRIHKGMVRPGRIDAVITIPPPDAPGIVKLCEVLVPEQLLDTTITKAQWAKVSAAMAGFIPAAINEACSRAVRYMVVRQNGEVNGAKIGHVDLVRAAEGLQAQMRLLEEAKDVPEREGLSQSFRYVLEPVIAEQVEAVIDRRLHENILLPR